MMASPRNHASIRKIDSRIEISLALAAKIGSIIVHADEATSAGGHDFDIAALRPLLNDADVRAFCAELGPLVPRKRSEDQPPRSGHAMGDEELYQAAVRIVIDDQKASASYVQRKLQLGYNTAARLLERMVADGIVSEPDRNGKRDTLLSAEEYAARQPEKKTPSADDVAAGRRSISHPAPPRSAHARLKGRRR